MKPVKNTYFRHFFSIAVEQKINWKRNSVLKKTFNEKVSDSESMVMNRFQTRSYKKLGLGKPSNSPKYYGLKIYFWSARMDRIEAAPNIPIKNLQKLTYHFFVNF